MPKSSTAGHALEFRCGQLIELRHQIARLYLTGETTHEEYERASAALTREWEAMAAELEAGRQAK